MSERALELLTVVAPMLDEEDTARRFHARVAGALDGLPWELVAVDDGSADATPQVLERWPPRIRACGCSTSPVASATRPHSPRASTTQRAMSW